MTGPVRILLINPPHTGRMVFPGINDRIAFRMHDFAPPLGLLYLKSCLEMHAPARVEFFNFQTPTRPAMGEFINRLNAFQPHIAGLTVLTPFWYGVCLVTETINTHRPETVIVGGGPHMWTYPEETLTRGKFDLIVQGQGEKPFLSIVDRLSCSRPPHDIPGTIRKDRERFITVPPEPPDGSALNALPFPDRTVLDIRQHRFSVNRHNPCALMAAGRGCPYHCSFCNNRERYYLPRDPDRIAEEMLICKNLGYRSIQFCDDVFTFSRDHVLDLCRRIRAGRVGLSWSCQTRVDCVDRELLREMAAAGCERVQFGIESANPRTLERIDKHIRPDQTAAAFSLCRRAGLATIGNIIIGFPWETMADIRSTFDFSFRLDADYIFCNPLIPFPGTRIFDEAARDPGYDGDWFRQFILSPAADAKIPLWTPHIGESEICGLIKHFYRRYYFHPRRIGRYLSGMTGPADIMEKCKTGLKLILYG